MTTITSPTGILITNDDGYTTKHAPFLLPFTRILKKYYTQKYTNNINYIVCVPKQQQSWTGKAVTRHSNITVHSNFNKDNWSQTVQQTTNTNDISLWSIVDGSPSTTCNVGLHTVTPFPIDLVISGPNLGRNCGRSFLLSSGTIAAAAEASMSKIKSIALSFGFKGINSWQQSDIENASHVACQVIDKLYTNWPSNVDMFNVNIIVGKQLSGDVYKTSLFHDTYGCLYRINEIEQHTDSNNEHGNIHIDGLDSSTNTLNNHSTMSFHVDFGIDQTKHPDYVGSDLWAMYNGHVSVTGLSSKNGLYDVDWNLDSTDTYNTNVKTADNSVKHINSIKMFSVDLNKSNDSNSNTDQKTSAL